MAMMAEARAAGRKEALKDRRSGDIEVLHDTWAKGFAEGAAEQRQKDAKIAEDPYAISENVIRGSAPGMVGTTIAKAIRAQANDSEPTSKASKGEEKGFEKLNFSGIPVVFDESHQGPPAFLNNEVIEQYVMDESHLSKNDEEGAKG